MNFKLNFSLLFYLYRWTFCIVHTSGLLGQAEAWGVC